jgi:hypothetical protein
MLAILGSLLLLSTGCGAVMCSFTGNAIGHCPALQQAAAQSQASSGGGEAQSEAAPEESAPAESSSSSEEPSAKAETNQSCKPSGATCDQSYQCCSGACVTHSPDDYCR